MPHRPTLENYIGSAVPSMITEILNNMLVTIPPQQVFDQFENAVKPLYQKKEINQIQIRTLTTLRDTLLPKLMSGEIRVVGVSHDSFTGVGTGKIRGAA